MFMKNMCYWLNFHGASANKLVLCNEASAGFAQQQLHNLNQSLIAHALDG
jgi:hypothetical protein